MPYLRVKNELPLIPGYSEGSIAYANDAAAAPLNECLCYINPVQSGSGDPSPSNVRPITGHTELNLVQKDGNDTVVHTYTTALGTTVYGGTLDPVSGVLTIDRAYITLTSSQNWTYSSGWSDSTTSVFYDIDVNTNIKYPNYDYQSIVFCDKLIPSTRNEVSNKDGKERLGVSGTVIQPSLTVRILSSRASTTQQFKDWLDSNPVHGVYELATPITTQLTPQEVKSLLGGNNFYHDCNGDTKITFIRRLDS